MTRRTDTVTTFVYANLHRQGRTVLLAICDAELLGITLRDGKVVFEIRERFYKGDKMNIEEAFDLVDQSTIINMVGCHSIAEAVKRRLIHPDAILLISGVPHAQLIRM